MGLNCRHVRRWHFAQCTVHGLVWSGLVWSGLVWSGLVWSGLVWSGLVWSGHASCRHDVQWPMAGAAPPPPPLSLPLPSSDKDVNYAKVKALGDVELGLPTQCIAASKAGLGPRSSPRGRSQYLANLSMKINAKLGGSNVLVRAWWLAGHACG